MGYLFVRLLDQELLTTVLIAVPVHSGDTGKIFFKNLVCALGNRSCICFKKDIRNKNFSVSGLNLKKHNWRKQAQEVYSDFEHSDQDAESGKRGQVQARPLRSSVLWPIHGLLVSDVSMNPLSTDLHRLLKLSASFAPRETLEY